MKYKNWKPSKTTRDSTIVKRLRSRGESEYDINSYLRGWHSAKPKRKDSKL